MWWRGGAGLIERSERGSLSAFATHDVFGFLVLFVILLFIWPEMIQVLCMRTPNVLTQINEVAGTAPKRVSSTRRALWKSLEFWVQLQEFTWTAWIWVTSTNSLHAAVTIQRLMHVPHVQ
jgi:hypothetical protein